MINHNIISQRSFGHDGNDCYIYECVSLIEVSNEHYIVLHSTKVIGWCADEYTTMMEFNNKADAGKYYSSRVK